MTDAGRGVIDLDLDADKVQRKLKGLDKGFASAGNGAGTRFGSGFLSSVGRSVSGLGRVVATAGAAAAVGLGAVAVAAGGFGLKIAADNETAAVSFKLLLGSAEKAGDFLKELQGFAAKTPFEFPELRDAASRLLAVGTNASDVIPIMETLGDATAAMGTGSEGISRAVTALTQIQQKGKVTGEEMLQLAEAGVPAWDALATVLGTDVAGAQKQVSDGTVEAATLFKALEDKAGPALQRVTGLMDVQATTLSGLLSTLKDTVGQNLGVQLQPLAETIKGLLPDITELAGSLATTFGGTAADLAGPLVGAFSSLAEIIGPVVESLGGGFADVFSGLALGFEAMGPGLAAFIDAFSGLGDVLGPVFFLLGNILGEALTQLAPVLDTLIEAIKPLVPILGSFLLTALEAIAPLWPVFQDAIEQIAPLVAELADKLGKELVKVLEDLLPVLIDNAPMMLEFAEAMLELLIAVLPIIGPIGKLLGVFLKFEGVLFAVVAKGIAALAAAIGAVVRFDYAAAWGKVTSAVSGFARTVGSLLPKVVGFFQRLPGQIVSAVGTLATVLIPKGLELIGGFLTGMVKKIPFLIGFMLGLPLRLVKTLVGIQQVLIPKALLFLAGFLTGLVRKLPELITFMIDLPGKLLRKLVDLGSKLIPKGIAFIGGLLSGFVQKLPDVLSWIGTLPLKLVGAIGRLGKLLVQTGKNLIEGLWNGIKEFDLIGKIKDFAGGIVGGFKSALGIGSPSKVMAAEIGVPIAQGIERGYRKASKPLPTPVVDQASIATQLGSIQPLGLTTTGSGQQVSIGEFHAHDGVDIDRLLFELGFKLAA